MVSVVRGAEQKAKPEQAYSESQVGEILREMWIENTEHLNRLHVRRLLLDIVQETLHNPNTGTYLPPPFDTSKLIFQAVLAEPMRAVQNFSSRIAANEVQVEVIPTSLKGSEIGKTQDKNAAEQERLLTSQWDAVDGRQAQEQIAWSQSWGRVGWYLTLPRDVGWGLPDRDYFEDLTDGEVESMKAQGVISPRASKFGRNPESGENWMQRRRKAAEDNAINARSLFTLEPLPPDMVLPRYEKSGTGGKRLKYAFVLEELPPQDFRPGSDLLKAVAKRLDMNEHDASRLSIMMKDGRVTAGIPEGGERLSQRDSTFVLARFITRDEIYYYITTDGGQAGGVLAFHQNFGGNDVPLYPAGSNTTDSRRPGGEFSSHMEQIFAQIPLLNQIETLLSNVATWNALGRFVVEDVDGRLVADEDGEPLVIKTGDDIVGMDPSQIATTRGKIKQLVIDAPMLLQLLEFYTARLDAQMPSQVTEGVTGASQPAWSVRLSLEASTELLRSAVRNHADAVQSVMQRWIWWMRTLDEPVFSFAAPGRRGSKRAVRGLIEFQPENLAETIIVQQSTVDAQQRIILQQQGIELEAGGHITPEEKFRTYFLADDPEEMEILSIASKLENAALFGASDIIQQGSVAWDTMLAIRGQITDRLLLLSPAFALETATDMAESAAINANQPKGNVSQATGQIEPGIGMALTQNPLQSPQGVAP